MRGTNSLAATSQIPADGPCRHAPGTPDSAQEVRFHPVKVLPNTRRNLEEAMKFLGRVLPVYI